MKSTLIAHGKYLHVPCEIQSTGSLGEKDNITVDFFIPMTNLSEDDNFCGVNRFRLLEMMMGKEAK